MSSYVRSLLLFTCLIVILLSIGTLTGEGDFRSFYTAGAQFLKHLNPYDPGAYPKSSPFGMPSMPLAVLLTAIPSHFPMDAAIRLWDLICLPLWMASLYLWMELFWSPPIRFAVFVRISAACMIAPVYWAFQSHQVIVPVLFFATLACWTSIRRPSSFWPGMATGLMLMKPHLTALLALALLIKSRRRWLFGLGTAIGLLLPLTPFLNTWRPASDLLGMVRAIGHYRKDIYFADEQGFAARAMPFFRSTLGGQSIQATIDAPGIIIPAGAGEKVHRIKLAVWISGLLLWVLAWSLNREMKEAALYAWSLAWGVLISVYSHSYDGILLTPLVMLALREGCKRRDLNNLFGLFFAVNFIAVWPLLVTSILKPIKWQYLGWASIFYFSLCGMMIAWSRKNDRFLT